MTNNQGTHTHAHSHRRKKEMNRKKGRDINAEKDTANFFDNEEPSIIKRKRIGISQTNEESERISNDLYRRHPQY